MRLAFLFSPNGRWIEGWRLPNWSPFSTDDFIFESFIEDGRADYIILSIPQYHINILIVFGVFIPVKTRKLCWVNNASFCLHLCSMFVTQHLSKLP